MAKSLTAKQVQELLAEHGVYVEDYNLYKSRKHKGAYVLREGFFYTHGKTAEDLVAKVLRAFPNAQIINKAEIWQTWPKDSYWEVVFRLN